MIPTSFTMTPIRDHFQESAQLAQTILGDDAFMEAMDRAGQTFIESLAGGHKILACGNGGSMCDAMHFAEELSGRYREDRKPLAAVALSDPSVLTCIANDYGFDQVFSRQVQAIGKPGDALLAISTSGNSENVLQASEAARELGMKVIALTGNGGGRRSEGGEFWQEKGHVDGCSKAQAVVLRPRQSPIESKHACGA